MDKTYNVELSEEQLALVDHLLNDGLGRHGSDVDDMIIELHEELPDPGYLARSRFH